MLTRVFFACIYIYILTCLHPVNDYNHRLLSTWNSLLWQFAFVFWPFVLRIALDVYPDGIERVYWIKNIHIYIYIASLSSVLGLFMIPLTHFPWFSVMLLEYLKNSSSNLGIRNKMLTGFAPLVSWVSKVCRAVKRVCLIYHWVLRFYLIIYKRLRSNKFSWKSW